MEAGIGFFEKSRARNLSGIDESRAVIARESTSTVIMDCLCCAILIACLISPLGRADNGI